MNIFYMLNTGYYNLNKYVNIHDIFNDEVEVITLLELYNRSNPGTVENEDRLIECKTNNEILFKYYVLKFTSKSFIEVNSMTHEIYNKRRVKLCVKKFLKKTGSRSTKITLYNYYNHELICTTINSLMSQFIKYKVM